MGWSSKKGGGVQADGVTGTPRLSWGTNGFFCLGREEKSAFKGPASVTFPGVYHTHFEMKQGDEILAEL